MKPFVQNHIIQEVAFYYSRRQTAILEENLITKNYYNGILFGIWMGVMYSSLQPKWLIDWLQEMWLTLQQDRSFGAKEFGVND